MDKKRQGSLNKVNSYTDYNESLENDGASLITDLTNRKIVHRSSHGTQHWKNIAFLLAMYDTVAVNLAYFSALWFRFDCHFTSIPVVYFQAWLRFCPVYTLVCLIVFGRMRMYRSLWRYISLAELNRIVLASIVTGAFHIAAITVLIRRMPVTYYIVGALLQFILVTSVRFSYRLYLLLILVNKNDCRIYATRSAPCLRDAYVFSQIGSKLSNSWTFSAIRLKICSLKTVVVLSMIESMVSLKVAKSL